jgi:hypothetical protein
VSLTCEGRRGHLSGQASGNPVYRGTCRAVSCISGVHDRRKPCPTIQQRSARGRHHTTPHTEPSKLASMAGTQSMMSRSMTSMRASTSGPSRRAGASLAVHHAPSCFLGRRVASSPDSALGKYGELAGLLLGGFPYVLPWLMGYSWSCRKGYGSSCRLPWTTTSSCSEGSIGECNV